MSTDDRQLLEAAAKAAGINYRMDGETVVEVFDDGHAEWNPLTDDGDALRLAVKLNIWPVRNESDMGGPYISVQRGAAYWCSEADESIGDNPYAATRRAIVRAAAAMATEKTHEQ